jgi:hypothetical protein
MSSDSKGSARGHASLPHEPAEGVSDSMPQCFSPLSSSIPSSVIDTFMKAQPS